MAQKKKSSARKKKAAPRKPVRRKPVARKPAARTAAGKRSAARPAQPRRERKQPETLRLESAAPGFTVNDVERSLGWYRDILGCIVKERWEQGGRLQGVQMLAGTVCFYLGQDDWKKGRDRRKGEGFRMYCTTGQHVDQIAATIKARGGVLDQEPTDQPWGVRDLTLSDPDGFKITIASAK
jgi:catechol 2,3-dioxygenase-like lactoylglutathione lyase family enzyme